jgi:UDP-2-acetamido-3-amino-2,3-dideoxy-glucuronate N-acetyltransferase
VVNKDVPDFALVVGVPGRQRGWMSAYGKQLDLPLSGEASVTCAHTGDIYTLSGSVVTRKEASAS